MASLVAEMKFLMTGVEVKDDVKSEASYVNVDNEHVDVPDLKHVDEPVPEPEPKSSVEVTKVLDSSIVNGKYSFLLKFKGYSTPEWLNEDDCNCEELISEYLHSKGVNTIHLFCRVSSKTQSGPNHVSLQAQEEALRQCASTLDKGSLTYRVKVHYIVGSAYKEIPKGLLVIGDAVKRNDVIMIHRVDRLSRNITKFLTFLEDLNKKGVYIYSLQEKLWYDKDNTEFLQAVVNATREADAISSRVKSNVAFRKNRGDASLGSVPYGYKLTKSAEDSSAPLVKVENDSEQNAINYVMSNYNGWNHAKVANQLNNMGCKKRGRSWSALMVRNLYRQKTAQQSLVQKKIKKEQASKVRV